jgi:hypothetical protein
MQTESIQDLHIALEEIQSWEKQQKSLYFWEKAMRYPYALLDKVTPKFVQEKQGWALDEIMSFVTTGGNYLVNEKDVVAHYRARPEHAEITFEEVSKLPIALMSIAAEAMTEKNATYAKVQGGVTGIGGIFTLAIDIPALLGLSFRALQEIAYAYGYDPKQESERIFIVKCLQFSSSDIVGKKAILDSMFESDSNKQVLSQLKGWREVMSSYMEDLGWKKLLQIVPIAGIIAGAYFNQKSLKDAAEAGAMLYRKRRILERLNNIEERIS